KDTIAFYATIEKMEDTLDYYLLDEDIPDWAKAEEKPTYDYEEITNTPNIPTTVASLEDAENYALKSDLTSLANVQADWDEANEESEAFIKNKPTIPSKTSDLTNDSGFLTEHQDISGKANTSDLKAVALSGDYNDLINTPALPSIEGLASETFVKDTIAFYATIEKMEDTLDYYLLDSDVPDWAKAEEKPAYDYSEIANTPTIPTTVASLEDAENYALKTDLTPLANVQADWNEADEESEAYIKNKPAIPNIDGLATTAYVDGKVEGLASEEFVQDTLDFYLLDSDVPDWAKAEEKPTYDYSEIANTPTIPTTVASLEDAENYALKSDLTSLANVQADWNEADEESEAFIQNKPTKVSDFENDEEFISKSVLQDSLNALRAAFKEDLRNAKLEQRKQTLGMMCNLAPNTIYKGALLSKFSVGPDKQVVFSQGNLQYRRGGEHLTAEGTMAPGTWRFAEHQFDAVGGEVLNEKGNDEAGISGNVYYNGVKCDNFLSVDENYEGWFDLFGYATSGWDNGKNVYQPGQFTDGKSTPSDYLIRDLTGANKNADWGIYNAISNGGNTPEQWRTLTKEEWLYLIYDRTNASDLFAPGIIHLDAPTEDGVEYMYGIIVLPDDWTSCPAGCSIVTTKSLSGTTYSYTKGFDISYEYRNEYTEAQWAAMQSYGAIFLPCAGTLRYDANYTNRADKLCMTKAVATSSNGCYFMATTDWGDITANKTSYFYFANTQLKYTSRVPNYAMNVRLVADVE
ncbi:MAG: hypothetical protein J6X43_05965, partial [Bacteroidales bacterium]|nr:hypothetical protein [Bacteroidales bacterium]